MELKELSKEVREELTHNILPFWMSAADLENGGWVGQINGNNETDWQANKGGVLHARMLWTFSAAYRVLHNGLLWSHALEAKEYLFKYFEDIRKEGIYWSCDFQGNPVDTKKQIYAQAFACYAFSEYYHAFRYDGDLKVAVQFFRLIEKHSFDPVNNGYFEAFAKDWSTLADVRLSPKDANEVKTMNTHLHILEAYTNLYRIWPNYELKNKIENLIELFLTRFIDDTTFHMQLFFTEDWTPRHHIVSYGHDMEASWLIHEAASAIANSELLSRTEPVIINMVRACFEGIQPDGSMAYERNMENGHFDKDRHWWVQAETVVGFINAYLLTQHDEYLQKAVHCWQFIKQNLIDPVGGEWFWSVFSDGTVNRRDDKLGIWKCPYHNARMCLEIIKRTEKTV